ncbi:MAG: YicC/YloC family endoribonuclease [Opitutales bacterium]
MRSMTGYGSGNSEVPTHQLRLLVEITSVNRKTLDLHIAGPREWSGLEQKCNEWIKGKFERGRLNIGIKTQSSESSANGIVWNESQMQETLSRLKKFADENSLPLNADGSLILRIAQSIQEKTALPPWHDVQELLKTAFEEALADLNTMRTKEGDALKEDLLNRITELETLHALLVEHSGQTVARYRDGLMERLGQLDLELDTSDERVLKEIALFADRCDISEELTRLASHLEQFKGLIQSEGSCGRKMDFLCQEIHREFNTVGSKANQIEITRTVIEAKNCLERVREQVQNVE